MKLFYAGLIMHLKRLLRRPSLLICLLLAPMVTYALGFSLSREEVKPDLHIGVYLPKEPAVSSRIWENLRAYEDASLQISRIAQEGELYRLVKGGFIDIGYVFPEDIESRIAQSRYSRMILRIASSLSPRPVTGWPMTYVLSAALLEACAPSIAYDFLEEHHIIDANDREGLFAVEHLFFDKDARMGLEIESISGRALPALSTADMLTGAALLRGMVALLLFLFSYLCALRFSMDAASGFFLRARPYAHPMALFLPAYIAPMLLSFMAGALSIGIAGCFFPQAFDSIGSELILLLFYVLYLAAFSFALSTLKEQRLIAALPFALILCLLFSPIVMDLGHFLNGGDILSLILPPTLYLRAAAGNTQAPLFALVMTLAYAALGTLLLSIQKRRKRN